MRMSKVRLIEKPKIRFLLITNSHKCAKKSVESEKNDCFSCYLCGTIKWEKIILRMDTFFNILSTRCLKAW